MGIAAIAAPQTSHHAALDAHASVWVSASAGSGKTTLLTKRVVALLLDGVAPSSILCLTYTKNAAAEMHTRVMAMLRGWLTLSDDALRTLLANDLGRPHTSLTEARGLYMKLLTAPRGVALQTIHSFCEGLLRQFPLEAGLPPTFTIMDTATQNELLRQALDSLYTAATRLPALRATLQQFAQDSAQSTFEESLADILTKHRTLRAMTERYATLAEYQAALEKALGLPSTVTIDDIRQRIMADRPLPLLREWYEKARAAPKAKKKQTFAEAITPFLADTPALASPEDYATCFLTQAHTPLKQIFDDDTRFFTEAERIASLLQQQKAVQSRDKALAYYTIGQAIIQAYTALKHAHGAYDFDDMIQHTLTLLHNSDMAQWVRFKLDAKLAHILVDEAQDTSQELWQLVDALTSDFFTQADTPRSLFVVGDFKQSIYSFQGAEPAIFQQQRTLYQEKVKASRRPWVDVRLDTCYRSAPTLLRFVDTVFDTPQSRYALGLDDERLHHSPARADDGTIIEVWPPFDKAEKLRDTPPFTETRAKQSPATQLGTQIAAEITQWLATQRPLPRLGRPVTAGDIMILFRNRQPDLLRALAQQLTAARLPYSMDETGGLLDELAIMDCMVVGDVMLWPDDDLSLACLLKTPFFEIDEGTLYDWCVARGDKSLWHYLYQAQPALIATLKAWRNQADVRSPSGFFHFILHGQQGLQKLQHRLGHDTLARIDEWLRYIYKYEEEEAAPSLQGCLAWLRRLQPAKSKIPPQAGTVRLLTVHGAKGLEAPIVFVCDVQQRAAKEKPTLIDAKMPALWPRGCAATRPLHTTDLIDKEHAAMAEEAQRLLYVALTRAEDELYITALDKPQAHGWYHQLANVMPTLAPETLDDGRVRFASKASTITVAPAIVADPSPLPSHWATAITPPLVQPSAKKETTTNTAAMEYGTMVHRVVQHRASLSPSQQATLVEWLYPKHPQAAQALSVATKVTLPQGWSEVPMVYKGENIRLDYVYNDAHGWHIVDVKSDASPPATPPAKYVAQLATYRAALTDALAQPSISTHLYWTQTHTLTRIDS